MGQVLKQGAVEIPSNEKLTVSQAILLVGGLADFADKRRVKLIRKKADGTTQVTIVDLVISWKKVTPTRTRWLSRKTPSMSRKG